MYLNGRLVYMKLFPLLIPIAQAGDNIVIKYCIFSIRPTCSDVGRAVSL